MEETLDHHKSFAAPLIFIAVISFQFISTWLELSKKVTPRISIIIFFFLEIEMWNEENYLGDCFRVFV